MPWPMAAKAAKAAKKAGKWQRWVLEAAERFMVRWHENDATLSRKRHASVMGGVQGNGQGRGKSRRETTVDGSRKEIDGGQGTRSTGR